jgi:hypothetical protein
MANMMAKGRKMTEFNPVPTRGGWFAALRTGAVLAGVLVLAAGCVAEPGYGGYASGPGYSPGYVGGPVYYGGGPTYYRGGRDYRHDDRRGNDRGRPGWSGNARPTPPQHVAPRATVRPGAGNRGGGYQPRERGSTPFDSIDKRHPEGVN